MVFHFLFNVFINFSSALVPVLFATTSGRLMSRLFSMRSPISSQAVGKHKHETACIHFLTPWHTTNSSGALNPRREANLRRWFFCLRDAQFIQSRLSVSHYLYMCVCLFIAYVIIPARNVSDQRHGWCNKWTTAATPAKHMQRRNAVTSTIYSDWDAAFACPNDE